MRRSILQSVVVVACGFGLLLGRVAFGGDDDLYGDGGGKKAPPAGSPFRVSTSLGMDARLIRTDRSTSWEKGGRGLTRYGAVREDQAAVMFTVPQIFLVHELYYHNTLNTHIQLNYSDHSDDAGKIGVVEAYVERKSPGGPWDWGMDARAGILIPLISLEHPRPGWNTQWTITPSAINTWVGEELRPLGAEVTVKKKKLSLTAAAFSGNDPSGTILSWRGWAMHDYQATYGSRLRTQLNRVNTSLTNDSPYKEIDGRVGFYGDASYHWGQGKLSFFYYNNPANGTAFDSSDYAWRTDFWNVSFKHNWQGNLDILAQYMSGTTGMGPSLTTVKNKFDAWYMLLSYRLMGQGRLSLRFDSFKVVDKDGWKNSSNVLDNNESKGKAVTIAYMHAVDDLTTLGLEYLYMNTERVGSVPYGKDDPKDNLLQALVRVIF